MARLEQFTSLRTLDELGKIPVGKKRKTIIDFSLQLPQDVPTDKIGVNLPAIHRQCRIGDIRKLDLIGEEGERTNMSYIQRISKPDSSEYYSQLMKVPTYRIGPHGEVLLNRSEIGNRIQGNDQDPNDAEAWARELNTAIQAGILRKGVKNLLNETSFRIFTIVEAYPATDLIVMKNVPFFIVLNLGGSFLFNSTLEALYSYKRKKSWGRWSIFPALPLDRAAALATFSAKDLLLGTQSIVRALPENTQSRYNSSVE